MMYRSNDQNHQIQTKMCDSNNITAPMTQQEHVLSEEKMKALSIKVQNVVCQKFQNKTIPMGEFAIKRLQLFPKLDHNEIQYGKHLGNGQFGIVFEIRDITLNNNNISCVKARRDIESNNKVTDYGDEEIDEQDRKFLETHCQRKNVEDGSMFGRYAIKKLRDNDRCCCNEESYYCGVMDLAVEAHILAGLEHPHIVKLRGLSRDADLGSANFFLIMDRLVCTLKDKLVQWKKYQRRYHLHDYFYYQRNNNKDGIVTTSLSNYKGITGGHIFHHYMKSINYNYNKMSTISKKSSTNNNKLQFLQERLTAMKDLSSAILYLHNHSIIDRDIKPDNIGFDVRGDIKLFDFGISTIFNPRDIKPFYHFTSKAGTLRYMAPEVYDVNRPYDESADIYSLSLVFWQMLSLEPLYPFKISSSKEFCELVFNNQTRPELNYKWSNDIKSLLSCMWDHNPSARPPAKKVNLILQRELASVKSECYNIANSSNDRVQKSSLSTPSRTNNCSDNSNKTKSSKNNKMFLKKLTRSNKNKSDGNSHSNNNQAGHAINNKKNTGDVSAGDNIGNTVLSCFIEEDYNDKDHQLLFVPRRNSTFVQRRFVTADEEK